MNNQRIVPINSLARVGTALADPVRQGILLALLRGPARPSELAVELDVSKSNLSNHLACLRGCGLIIGDQQGRTIAYRLVSDDLHHALDDLARLEATLCPISD
jgi:ArsR family transcriptional regulator, cadmium/lead-responsive transcriptional repressor